MPALAALGLGLCLVPWGWALASATRGQRKLVRAHRGVQRHSALAVEDGFQLSQSSSDENLKLKSLFPWYHTTDELRAEARSLEAACAGALAVRSVEDSGVALDVARVRALGASPVNRVFVLFGEHSRELISPESGLYLLKVLCEKAAGDGTSTAAETLRDSEFEIVLNGNPRSRREVEAGAFCTRTNPDGVDLNRNWDEKWKPTDGDDGDAYPGPRPFSEPETRIFRRLVTEYRPTTFLTVHSGTRGVYMPWAYDTSHLASRNRGAMLEILKSVDEEHCQCPYGAAGKEVGYSCPGTCLDWVYDQLQTPYSFAFEIYGRPENDAILSSKWEDKLRSGGASLLQSGNHLGHTHFLDLLGQYKSDFVQLSSPKSKSEPDSRVCFADFNPDTLERFDATVRNWASAYLKMSQMVVANMRSHNSTLHVG